MALELIPTTISDAQAFVGLHHRHHRAPRGGLFAVAVQDESEVVGVAIVGRPVARMLCDGWTAEVTRVCTLGRKNACSMLYGACWRACRSLGYKRLVTYILSEERGVTLSASGWTCLGECGGGKWGRKDRPLSVDRHPLQTKIRWERSV